MSAVVLQLVPRPGPSLTGFLDSLDRDRRDRVRAVITARDAYRAALDANCLPMVQMGQANFDAVREAETDLRIALWAARDDLIATVQLGERIDV